MNATREGGYLLALLVLFQTFIDDITSILELVFSQEGISYNIKEKVIINTDMNVIFGFLRIVIDSFIAVVMNLLVILQLSLDITQVKRALLRLQYDRMIEHLYIVVRKIGHLQ